MHAIVHGLCGSVTVMGAPETALRLLSFIRHP
jgi:hypothetical protein